MTPGTGQKEASQRGQGSGPASWADPQSHPPKPPSLPHPWAGSGAHPPTRPKRGISEMPLRLEAAEEAWVSSQQGQNWRWSPKAVPLSHHPLVPVPSAAK